MTIILYIEFYKMFSPIRSGLFQTANDPGGRGFYVNSKLTFENCFVNLYHMIHVHFTRCFRHVSIGIFQKFYSNFKIKSSENSCKNNIFVILFKIDFKYTKNADFQCESNFYHK